MQTDEIRQMDAYQTNPDTTSIKIVCRELVDKFLTVFNVDKFYKPLLDLNYQDSHDFRYCEICYTQRNSQEYLSIWKCSHETCIYCIAQFLDFKIQVQHTNDSQFQCLVCSQGDMVIEKLQQFIRYAPVKDLTAAKTYSFLSKRVQMRDKPIYYCISPVCRWILDPIQGENFYKCQECATTFCKECGFEGHYERSCSEYRAYKEKLDLEDPQFLEYMKTNKLQLCPKCGIRVERIGGCPHMTCQSPICKGSCEFCYYCGIQVTGWDYSTHYTPDSTNCFNYIERNPIQPLAQDMDVMVEEIGRVRAEEDELARAMEMEAIVAQQGAREELALNTEIESVTEYYLESVILSEEWK